MLQSIDPPQVCSTCNGSVMRFESLVSSIRINKVQSKEKTRDKKRERRRKGVIVFPTGDASRLKTAKHL